jgi:outer membrane protein TolC
MTRKHLIWIAILIASTAHAQSGLDRVLTEIAKNNKAIQAERQLQEAEKLQYRTGLNPENPRVDYEYLPGSPAGAGTQKDIAVTQALDFPTSYIKRRDVSREKTSQSDLQFNIFRQDIMLRAKQTCIEYIYRVKLHRQYEMRLRHAESLIEATSRKVDQGEATILDLNKARLLQLDIRNQVDLNATEIKTFQHQIDELNGGMPTDLSQVDFPVLEKLSNFQSLDSAIEANDPEVTAMKQNRIIQRNQLELMRALSLPKFEGGSQAVDSESNLPGVSRWNDHTSLGKPECREGRRIKIASLRGAAFSTPDTAFF